MPFLFIQDAEEAVEHAKSLNLVTHTAKQKVKQDAEKDRAKNDE